MIKVAQGDGSRT